MQVFQDNLQVLYLQFPAQASYLVSPTAEANILFLISVLFIFLKSKRTFSEQHVNPLADQRPVFLQRIFVSQRVTGTADQIPVCVPPAT